MNSSHNRQVWFVTGSQHLYGQETLDQVRRNAQAIADGLNASSEIPVTVLGKGIVTTPDEILAVCRQASNDASCVGLICWMHTFSPAKMWISGLKALQKPFMHLHTQYNRDLPWDQIDMDFMNLNQSAHGGREFGFIVSRMRIDRKVVVGHWQEKEVQQQVGDWTRAAVGVHELQSVKVARFGDNMREVAVTEGDKVGAQIDLGISVYGYGIGDLVALYDAVPDADVNALVEEYRDSYTFSDDMDRHPACMRQIRQEARIERALRTFLGNGGFTAFTNTFEDLHGLPQLPGLATQRLMADGFGYGAEGDWKTAAMLRAVKVMTQGLAGGTSFMEDYTYDFGGSKPQVLGAHMLEICPTIADGRPELSVRPLGIGGKADPVRLVFTAPSGPAVNITLIDMGDRFRLIVNEVDTVAPAGSLARLPVARAVWQPRPSLATAAASWILAGGAHHSVFSQAIRVDHMVDLAEMLGIECLLINNATTVPDFKDRLRWNEVYWASRK